MFDWSNWTKKQQFWVFLAIVLLCIFARHFALILNPNQSYLGASGDGFKNYATPIYHIKYDSTYTHYQGMNYPYGDHVLFSDNQPILSNIIKFTSSHVYDISDYTVGIINIAMLLSILCCALFLYLIFGRLQIPFWYAGISAIGICFLSPQLVRMDGHFGLSHTLVIPMILYMMMRFEEKRSLLISILIALSIIFLAQVHFYYFGITAFFIGIYTGLKILFQFSKKRLSRDLAHLFIQIFIPFLILQYWVNINGSIPDRPNSPYGFLDYHANWEGIVLPHKYPLAQLVSEHITEVRPVFWENMAYIGIIAALFCLYLITRFIRLKGVFDWSERTYQKQFINYSLSAGFLLLLFSMGLPFIIPGLEFIVNYLGPLKQFRGIGRFAWLFYYVINIAAFYGIYRFWSKWNTSNWLKNGLLVIVFSVLFFDVYQFNRIYNYRIFHFPELNKDYFFSSKHWKNKISPDQFQAIVPLPYFHTGSENFWIEPQDGQFDKTIIPSLVSSIPLNGVLISRTPLSQTINNIQLSLNNYELPPILKDYNEKDLLLIKDKESYHKKPNYDELINIANPIYEDEKLQLYTLSIKTFTNNIKSKQELILNEMQDSLLFNHQVFLSSDSIINYIYNDFDQIESSKYFQGTGALSANNLKALTLFDGKIPNIEKPIFSCWIFIQKDLHALSSIHFKELDQSGNLIQKERHYRIDEKITAINNGWARLEFPIRMKDKSNRILISLNNTALQNEMIYTDEMLIRGQKTQLYKQLDSIKMKNNYWFNPQK